jgi:hypothetical protein
MVEEFQSGREVSLAIAAMRESIVALRDQMDASIVALRDQLNAQIVGLRDQLTLIKWVMGGFGVVTVSAFGYLFFTTTQTTVAVAGINAHLVSVNARLDGVDKRIEALESRMDKRFEAVDARFEAVDKRFEAVDAHSDALELRMDKRFDALTTLILNLQPPQKRTEGFTLAPGPVGRQ